jgi:hypothetical protein
MFTVTDDEVSALLNTVMWVIVAMIASTLVCCSVGKILNNREIQKASRDEFERIEETKIAFKTQNYSEQH